jgi:hypothetical protein
MPRVAVKPSEPAKRRRSVNDKPSTFEGERPSGPVGLQTTPAERRVRLRLAMNLVAFGMSREEAIDQLSDHVLKKDGVELDRSLLKGLVAEAEELVLGRAREPRELAIGRQIMRLESHLAEARKAGNWSAVASLEDKLAKIKGTYAPVRVAVEADARMKSALERVLLGQNIETLQALARGERPPLGSIKVVDTTGTGEDG